MNDLEKGVELVHALVIARQGRRQIEPEPIDVHVVDPVTEAIHHELEGARMKEVERVPRSREIRVFSRIFG